MISAAAPYVFRGNNNVIEIDAGMATLRQPLGHERMSWQQRDTRGDLDRGGSPEGTLE